jgi:hypothetical protein
MRAMVLVALFLPVTGHSFTLREAVLKSRAFMVHSAGGIYEALDLKSKTVTFDSKDFESCGQSMKRNPNSLSFSCTISLNNRREQSILRVQMSQPVVQVPFGGIKKFVRIDVSRDARTVTFSTRLDDTGVDHQVAQFNEEFYKIQSKIAQLIFSEAMTTQNLELRVLESSSPEIRPAAGISLPRANDARM